MKCFQDVQLLWHARHSSWSVCLKWFYDTVLVLWSWHTLYANLLHKILKLLLFLFFRCTLLCECFLQLVWFCLSINFISLQMIFRKESAPISGVQTWAFDINVLEQNYKIIENFVTILLNNNLILINIK